MFSQFGNKFFRQSFAVTGGEMTIVDLRLWMGYRIDYNPLLPWLLAAAFLAVNYQHVWYSQSARGYSLLLFAAIVLTIIPSVLVYVFLHERIIKGLAAGAVKG